MPLTETGVVSSRYRIQFGDREIDVPGGELVVGRAVGCHLRLRAPSVSRRHLRILLVADSVVAYDLDSRNGTWVNDRRIEGPTRLADGDLVLVGTQSFRLRKVRPEDELDEAEPETWETTAEAAARREAARGAERRAARPLAETVELAATRETLLPTEGSEDEPSGSTGEAAQGFDTGEQRCLGCGTRLGLDTGFCPSCGRELYSEPTYRTCPGCRSLVAADQTACPRCGLERPRPDDPHDPHDPDDRRGSRRRATSIRALYISSSLTFDAEVSDISRGGLFMAAELLDPVGTHADIVLSTRDRGGARFVGEVVRAVAEADPDRDLRPGMGLRFIGVMPEARRWLEGYLAALDSPQGQVGGTGGASPS